MAKKIKIDFSGVDKDIRAGGRSAHVPEGDYLLKIVSAEFRKTDEGSRWFQWTLTVVSPKEYKGKKLKMGTSLKPDALWNLRNLIYAALGKNVAGKALDFDPAKLYGKVVAATAVDDTYERNNKEYTYSAVEDVRPKEELDQGDDDEDEEDEDEADEEVEDDEEEELEDVDVDEL